MRALAFSLLCLACCLHAFLRGGGPERIMAGIFSAGLILSYSTAYLFHGELVHALTLMLVIDSAMLIGTLGIALYADRFWPLWMCAMQMAQVLSHLPMLMIPHLLPHSYGVIISLWGYPMLLLLVIATFRHQDRLKKSGTDPSWSCSVV